jgi:heptose I phosphotransferase
MLNTVLNNYINDFRNKLKSISISRHHKIYYRAPDWQIFYKYSFEYIFNSQSDIFFHYKQGRCISYRYLYHNDNVLTVFIKRHYTSPWYIRLLAYIYPNKSWSAGLREWEWLCWARQRGWLVPRPLAAGQYIGPGLQLRSFLIVQELGDTTPLHEAIPYAARHLSPDCYKRWKCLIFDEVVRIVSEMHKNRCYHNDLYICHFFISNSSINGYSQDVNFNLYLIDFHRFVQTRFSSIWKQSKDLAQLFFSLKINHIDSNDITSLWNMYSRRMGLNKFYSKLLYGLVKFRVHLYKRHEARREK